MRIAIVSGITTDETAEFRTSYPTNLEAVAVNNKLADAQYRMTSGTLPFATGPGIDRGGILWNGIQYRVMGTRLVSISSGGVVTDYGDVGGSGPVSLDYGFDRLGIRSGTNLFYLKNGILTQVTDTDLGPVLDMLWIDGYFMTTDGTSVIVTELNDPTSVLPLKYGSAEEDPDMVTGLIKLREEAYVLGSNTIQVFRNVGGNGFPFATQKGASIPVGCVGPNAKCFYADTFAFVGSSRNEGIGVYLAGSGTADRISQRFIDDALAKVADPSDIILESRLSRGERRLFVHLPDKSFVFLANASRLLQQSVWYIAETAGKPYRPRNAVMAYGKTFVGDTETSAIGELTDTVATHFGEVPGWQFDAGPISNDSKGAILTSVELLALPGRGADGTMFMSMTRDGENWSVERAIPMGKLGERLRRLIWRPRANLRSWMGLRFRGMNAALPGFAGCDIGLEPLSV